MGAWDKFLHSFIMQSFFLNSCIDCLHQNLIVSVGVDFFKMNIWNVYIEI